MASRVSPRRLARAATTVAALVAPAVAVVLGVPALGGPALAGPAMAAPAFADTPIAAPVAPPGWRDPGSGAWVAFTFDDTTLAPVSRHDTRWGPVTIRRSTSVGLNLADAFTSESWDVRDGPQPGISEYGWPGTWQLGDIELQRVDWCDRDTATSCQYYAVGGAGQRLFFAAGNPTTEGIPDPEFLLQFDQQTALALGAPSDLDIVFSWDPSTATTPANGTTPGRLTLDASGSSDHYPGTLVFDWVVTRASDSKTFTASPDAVAHFELDADDVYCVALTVTNTDPANRFSKTYGVDGADCQFVTGVAPQASAGAGSGGSGVGGIPTTGNEAAPTVAFAPAGPPESALTGSGSSAGAGVVWLWQPDWYQASSQTQTLPQTSGAPRLKARADIVVSGEKAPDSNAGPWLAGLGAFGLIGVGWVLNKRRRVRAEY